MAEDISMLNDIFNLYYKKAKEQHQNGQIDLAKRNYLLAAETLMKIAKQSSEKLKKAQVERAKRLIQIADNLKQEDFIRKATVQNGGATKTGAEGELNQEDGGKIWTEAEIPNVHFSDIAGLDDVKQTIYTRMINPIKYPEKYAAYGKKTGGGVLLYGPPGTGKTMIAKAIACEVGAKFYTVKGSDIMSKWVGESEKNISSLFETARAQKLSIIFIDEMDSLFGTRGKDSHNDKRVNEFLQQIDGFAGKAPNLLLLGATNRPWDVDSAAVRSGRFSEKIYVPLPDAPARLFLLKKYFSNAPLGENLSWKELVEKTKGYSGADIEELCDRAKERPLNAYIKTNVLETIDMDDIEYALSKVRSSINPKELKEFEDYSGITYCDNLDKI